MMTPEDGGTDTSQHRSSSSRSTLVTHTLTILTSALDVSTLAAQLGQSPSAATINHRSEESHTRGVKRALQRCHRNLCCLKGFLRGLVERRSPINHDVSEDYPDEEDEEDEEEEDRNNGEMLNISFSGMIV